MNVVAQSTGWSGIKREGNKVEKVTAQEVMEREKWPNLIAQGGSGWGWRCLGEKNRRGGRGRAEECFGATQQRRSAHHPDQGSVTGKVRWMLTLGVMAALSPGFCSSCSGGRYLSASEEGDEGQY